MTEFWAQHQMGLIVFEIVLLAIALSNLRALRRIDRGASAIPGSRVSILLPARNEAANIEACARSLLAQDYPDFEVLALDDDSYDGTGAILAQIAADDARLRTWPGAPLPQGWLGKHWACHQLAQAATGDLLLFTDADTRWHPRALTDAVGTLERERADLLSALPHQETQSWGERLTVPLIYWSLFCFLPLAVAHRLQWPPLSATIGQFMLFRRAAYERVGGYATVRSHAADDVTLGRRVIARGGRWRLADAGARVRCRMYGNFEQAFGGFGKNLYAAFDYRPWLFVPIWLWLGVVFLEPPVVLLLALAGAPWPPGTLPLAGAAIVVALALWALVDARFKFPPYLAPLYPVRVAVAVAVAARSLVDTLTGRATWKGRVLNTARGDGPH